MILPDINLLVYTYNEAVAFHRPARAWWEDLMRREVPVALPWAVIFGFLRIVTHPAVLVDPLPPAAALARIKHWIKRPNVRILEPGPHHLRIVGELLDATGVAANLTTDTHLAALAIEHQCELHSNDGDFRCFPGLRWINPLR